VITNDGALHHQPHQVDAALQLLLLLLLQIIVMTDQTLARIYCMTYVASNPQ
jgi:hypothetical protein